MTLTETTEVVRVYFTEHCQRWQLRPERLTVDYIPSPGGFGSMNFVMPSASIARIYTGGR